VTAGGMATYTLGIGGAGVAGTAALTCTSARTGVTCSVPASVLVSASSTITFKVTVTTMARTTAYFSPFGGFRTAWFCAVALLGLLWWPKAANAKQSVRSLLWAASALLMLAAAGCGGGSGASTPPPVSGGTPAGSYNLTVTATSGSTTQSVPLTLTVQ